MSAYLYTTQDVVVTRRPCRLYSVVVSTDGGGPGKVVLYDEQSAVAGREIATLLTGGNNARHFHWRGLKLHRGLYVDIVEKADYVTIEWEPAGD